MEKFIKWETSLEKMPISEMSAFKDVKCSELQEIKGDEEIEIKLDDDEPVKDEF